jgi:hypothetical protein
MGKLRRRSTHNSTSAAPQHQTEGQLDLRTAEQLAQQQFRGFIELAARQGGQVRCGDVWGTRCRAWVTPPDFNHAGHGDHGIMRMVAKHPQCPPYLLRQLSWSPASRVRRQVARHPQCPPDLVLEMGLRDRDLDVYTEALLHPKFPAGEYPAVIRRMDASAINRLARRPECSMELLRAVGVPGNAWYGYHNNIARHSNCPPDLLREYAASALASGLSTSVAKNPNCPPDLLIQLLNHPVAQTRRAALDHPNLPEEYRVLAAVAAS